MAKSIKDYSAYELMQFRTIAVNAIENAKKKISGQGGWIAREANQETIDNATRDIEAIDAELKIRK